MDGFEPSAFALSHFFGIFYHHREQRLPTDIHAVIFKLVSLISNLALPRHRQRGGITNDVLAGEGFEPPTYWL